MAAYGGLNLLALTPMKWITGACESKKYYWDIHFGNGMVDERTNGQTFHQKFFFPTFFTVRIF